VFSSGAGRWRITLWLALLVAASVAFTFGFACAVPFAAFGAAAALTLARRDALLLAGMVWLANQAVGFAFLGYPLTSDCIAWGLILGVIALSSTLAAQWISTSLAGANAIVVALASFAAAFVMYEGGLFLVAATVMGGTENFVVAAVFRILEINTVAFLGLQAVNQVRSTIDTVGMPALARS
jgi:hypothetical protein